MSCWGGGGQQHLRDFSRITQPYSCPLPPQQHYQQHEGGADGKRNGKKRKSACTRPVTAQQDSAAGLNSAPFPLLHSQSVTRHEHATSMAATFTATESCRAADICAILLQQWEPCDQGIGWDRYCQNPGRELDRIGTGGMLEGTSIP